MRAPCAWAEDAMSTELDDARAQLGDLQRELDLSRSELAEERAPARRPSAEPRDTHIVIMEQDMSGRVILAMQYSRSGAIV